MASAITVAPRGRRPDVDGAGVDAGEMLSGNMRVNVAPRLRARIPRRHRCTVQPRPTPDDATAALHRRLARDHAALAARSDAVLRDQLAIHAIPAPTGLEGTRAGWIADRFRDLALINVHLDAVGNVRGMRPGAALAPLVIVGAHLDTVFDATTPLDVRRDGTRYVAPGIADNARGLAALVALAAACDGDRVRTVAPLLFVATTGEEGSGDLRGARALFDDLGDSVTAAVMLDGAGDEAIVHGALGARRLRVSWRGAGGHSWAAFGTANPLHARRRAPRACPPSRSHPIAERHWPSPACRADTRSTRSRPMPGSRWIAARPTPRRSTG